MAARFHVNTIRYFLDAQEAWNVSAYKAVSHVSGEETRLHIEHADEPLSFGEKLIAGDGPRPEG